jgi:tetratricopeptide (TPR) repeat protein
VKKLILPILLIFLGIFLLAFTPSFLFEFRGITFTSAIFSFMSAMILFMTYDKGSYTKKFMVWLAFLLSVGTGPVLLDSNLAWLLVPVLGIPLTILWFIYLRHPLKLWKFIWLVQKKKQTEAAQYINEWIRSHPHDWRMFLVRSEFHLNRAQVAEAERDARMAVKLKPDYHESHNQVGRCLLITGQYEEARAAFESAQKLKSNNQYLANLGATCYTLGDYPAAVEALTQATRQPLDHPLYTMGAYYYLGCSLENIGEHKKAQEAFTAMKQYAADIDQYIAQFNAAPDFPGTVATRAHFMDIKRRLNS